MNKRMSDGGHDKKQCSAALLPVRDALEILNGKWKLQIIVTLAGRTMRFRELAREVVGITDKMLSKELKDLELNHLVRRTVLDTFPPTVEYCHTEHAKTLDDLIVALQKWGSLHRMKVMGGEEVRM